MSDLGHILIVDDEPSVVYTLKCILEKVGYRISSAEDWEQARAALNSETVDVIICDLALNGENGAKLLENARALQPEVGQVLLTGYAPPEMIEELESRGIAVFMKPVEMARSRSSRTGLPA